MTLKELLPHAKTWVNLTNTVLSKRSQAQKITYHMVPFKLKHRRSNLCSSQSKWELLWQSRKRTVIRRRPKERRVASGNFYFLTSTVVTHMFTLS